MTVHLYVGNRNYSSWSLRAWLSIKWADVDFTETVIDLDQSGYGKSRIADVLAVSPSGLVPALKLGKYTIWDSLAIGLWATEQSKHLLPTEPIARATMYSVVGEMHSGFTDLRRELPMNIRRRCAAYGLSLEAEADITRVDAIWKILREQYAAQGDYLFGTRSLADAFFLPVATRFRTYGTELSALAQEYCEFILTDRAFQEWEKHALEEHTKPFSRAKIDQLYPTPI